MSQSIHNYISLLEKFLNGTCDPKDFPNRFNEMLDMPRGMDENLYEISINCGETQKYLCRTKRGIKASPKKAQAVISMRPNFANGRRRPWQS